MILMIDNYDSFTYNVVQYLGELGADVAVHRNDEITLAQIEKMAPEKIVISPGPCTPSEAGISLAAVAQFGAEVPILGIYLGRDRAHGKRRASDFVHCLALGLERDEHRGDLRRREFAGHDGVEDRAGVVLGEILAGRQGS